jgi:hypothetical protein
MEIGDYECNEGSGSFAVEYTVYRERKKEQLGPEISV